MAKGRKVVITCAVTGAIHTPSMSPHLPITPDQIVAESLAAAEAGAAVLHLHARDPATGKPYGMTFPIVSIADFVEVEKALVESLGIGLPTNAAIPAADSRRYILAHMVGRRIVDSIGVIEGIAFQTNLLALNAGVEAALLGVPVICSPDAAAWPTGIRPFW